MVVVQSPGESVGRRQLELGRAQHQRGRRARPAGAISNRDRAGALLPVIDRANVWTQTASDPAFARWTARRNWIDSTLTLIEHEGDTQTSPLARLDHVIAKFVGNIDLTALATRDANGRAWPPTWRRSTLDLDGFRFLVRCRALLAAGTAGAAGSSRLTGQPPGPDSPWPETPGRWWRLRAGGGRFRGFNER